jgi:hypothetical protein
MANVPINTHGTHEPDVNNAALSGSAQPDSSSKELTLSQKRQEREDQENHDQMLQQVMQDLSKILKEQGSADTLPLLGLEALFPDGVPSEKQIDNAIKRQKIILKRAQKIPRYVRATARTARPEKVPNLGSDLWQQVKTLQRMLSTLIMLSRVLVWSAEAAGLFLLAHAGTLEANEQRKKFLEAGFGVALALQRPLSRGLLGLTEGTWEELATKTERAQQKRAQNSVHLTRIEIFLSWSYIARIIKTVDARQPEKIVKQSIDELRLFNVGIHPKHHLKSAQAYVAASHDAFGACVNVAFGSGINHSFISTSLAAGGVLIGVVAGLLRAYYVTRASRDRRQSSLELDEFHEHLLEKGAQGVRESATEAVGRRKRFLETILFWISLASIVVGTVFMIRGEAAHHKELLYGDEVLIKLIPAVLNYALAFTFVWKFRSSSAMAVQKGVRADSEFLEVQDMVHKQLDERVPKSDQRRRDAFPYQILRDYATPPELSKDMRPFHPKLQPESFELDFPEHPAAGNEKITLDQRELAEAFLYALIQGLKTQNIAINFLRLQHNGASYQCDDGKPVPIPSEPAPFICSICTGLRDYEEITVRPKIQTVRIREAKICYVAKWIDHEQCQLDLDTPKLPPGVDTNSMRDSSPLLEGSYSFQVANMRNELEDKRAEKRRGFVYGAGRTLLQAIQLGKESFKGLHFITCTLDSEKRELTITAANDAGKITTQTRKLVRDKLAILPRRSLVGFDFIELSKQQLEPRTESRCWKEGEKDYPLYDMYNLLEDHLPGGQLVLQKLNVPTVESIGPTKVVTGEDGVLVCGPLDKFRVLNQEMRVLAMRDIAPGGDVEAGILRRLSIPVRIWQQEEVTTRESDLEAILRMAKVPPRIRMKETRILKLKLSEGQARLEDLHILRRGDLHFEAILPDGFKIHSGSSTAEAEKTIDNIGGRNSFYEALRAAAKLAPSNVLKELGSKGHINIERALTGDESTLHVSQLRELVVDRTYEELEQEDSDLEKGLNKLAERAFFSHYSLPTEEGNLLTPGEFFDMGNKLGKFLLKAPSQCAVPLKSLKALLLEIHRAKFQNGTGDLIQISGLNDLKIENGNAHVFDFDNELRKIDERKNLPELNALLEDLGDRVIRIQPSERRLRNEGLNGYSKYVPNWVSDRELNLALGNLNVNVKMSKDVDESKHLQFEAAALRTFLHARHVAEQTRNSIRKLSWNSEQDTASMTAVTPCVDYTTNQKVRGLIKGRNLLDKGAEAIKLREEFDSLSLEISLIQSDVKVTSINEGTGGLVQFNVQDHQDPRLSTGPLGLWEPQEKYFLLNREIFVQAINDCILWADQVEVTMCQLNKVPLRVWQAGSAFGKEEWKLVQNYDVETKDGYLDLLRRGNPSDPGHYVPITAKWEACDTGCRKSPEDVGNTSSDGNCFYYALAQASRTINLLPEAKKFLSDLQPGTLRFAITNFIRNTLDGSAEDIRVVVAKTIDLFLTAERDRISVTLDKKAASSQSSVLAAKVLGEI